MFVKPLMAAVAALWCSVALSAQNNPPISEAEIHQYRETLSAAGKALEAGNAAAAFPQVLAMAQKGFAEAQYIVATLYHDGEGTPADSVQARHWYQAAAQNSNPAVAQLAKEALAQLP